MMDHTLRSWFWVFLVAAGCTVQTAAAPPIVGSLDDRVTALEAKIASLDGGGATVSGVPTGTVVAFAGSVPPDGWVLCDGSQLDGTDPQYAPLFKVISTTYGGEGSMFKLPDLKGRLVMGAGTYTDPVLQSTTRKLGDAPGAAAHQLTIAEMPSHTHVQDPHTHVDLGHSHLIQAAGSSSDPVGNCVAISNPTFSNPHCSDYAYPDLIDTSYAQLQETTATNEPTGGDQPFETLPPSMVLNYIIKL